LDKEDSKITIVFFIDGEIEIRIADAQIINFFELKMQIDLQ